VRGDYGNFVLVVDHGSFFKDNIIFSSFDDSSHTYFVAEPAAISFASVQDLPASFRTYEHVQVLGKYPINIIPSQYNFMKI
jgi:hypothetical protein